jgi:hypothetical protein
MSRATAKKLQANGKRQTAIFLQLQKKLLSNSKKIAGT